MEYDLLHTHNLFEQTQAAADAIEIISRISCTIELGDESWQPLPRNNVDDVLPQRKYVCPLRVLYVTSDGDHDRRKT